MPSPASLRDSTQIVLPSQSLDGLREQVTSEFTVSIVETDTNCRIIGSPLEIKAVSEYLSRQGVRLR